MTHKTAAELEQGMGTVTAAPKDQGAVLLVVRRPGKGEREIVDEAELDMECGLVGDDWINRPGIRSDVPSPYAQITIMNARYTELIAGADHEAWALAGDQLYIDLDISRDNMPAGTRISIGAAVVEIQAEPHTSCVQFNARFGSDAVRASNTERGRQLRLRGANATVVQSGTVRTGDFARKL